MKQSFVKMRVVLPSNASMEHFPNNSLTSYTVQFSEEIILPPGQWEVGLLEMQFEKSWYNLQDGKIMIIETGTPPKFVTIDFKVGYYPSPIDICNALNQQLKVYYGNEPMKVEFGVDDISGRVTITFRSYGINVAIDEDLGEMLGIAKGRERTIFRNFVNYDDKRPEVYTTKVSQFPNMNPVKSIYVYSDIVQNSRVGEIEAPLLRIVPVNNSKHWTTQYVEYQKIQYVPVSKNRFRQISIYLRSDTGDIVPFTTGRTIVTLGFRRVKPMVLV